MPASFITMGVQRIALEGPLEISSSALLAIHLAPTVTLDWNKGRLVVDLEVSWVSPRHFMKYWGAYRDWRERWLESSATCSSLSLESSGEALPNIISQGVKTSYMEERSGPEQKKEAYPSFNGIQWEFVWVLLRSCLFFLPGQNSEVYLHNEVVDLCLIL